jgi:ethanolamine ammonia-lyase large subunit
MPFSCTLRNERFFFADLKTLFAKANEVKSGDQLAEIAATSERERVAAKIALADVPLQTILDHPLLDPNLDEVTKLILEQHDASSFEVIRSLTVGEFREYLLSTVDLKPIQAGVTPEMAAAVTKLMSNKDLILVASRIQNVSRCRNTIGLEGTFSVRIQPNHPTDDLAGILYSAVDGLTFGCGDAVIGVNPAVDSVKSVQSILELLQRLISKLEIPTQACCLAHITTQLQAMQLGAPIDLLFQSIAGTQKANSSFAINLNLLKEGKEAVAENHRKRDVKWVGDQLMYFETGQGSALSADAHHGIDQLTLEARAYGVARAFDPFLVNSVVGFIGPEYLADERQIIRAGLEDHFMGKLLGLPMGCDVCFTNHVDADHNSADNLLVLLATAGCNFIMGVPGGDDVMLNYQSTSYHDAVAIRELLRLQPSPEFRDWLESNGIFREGHLNDLRRSEWLTQAQRILV